MYINNINDSNNKLLDQQNFLKEINYIKEDYYEKNNNKYFTQKYREAISKKVKYEELKKLFENRDGPSLGVLSKVDYVSILSKIIPEFNDNEHMIENIEAKMNSENFLLYFSKNDLDTNLFTLNKRISIHNIDRYREFNGTYLLYRKREVYLREDTSFTLSSMINLKRIELDTNIIGVETANVATIKTAKPPTVNNAKKNSYASNVNTKLQQHKPQTTSGSIFIPSSLKYYKSNR